MKKRLRNVFDQYHQPENHITNSLLLVLNHNRDLLSRVLSHLGIRLSHKQINLLSQVAPKKADNRLSIPDGYIYTDDFEFCIGIETKIEPGALERRQLIGHLNQLEQYSKSFLLILTPDEQEPSIVMKLKKKFSNIRFVSWQNLLEIIVKAGPDKKDNSNGCYLFSEFIKFMERKYHMTPFTGINFEDGYDEDLAKHYIKRISEIITPDIIELFPECTNKRPAIRRAWQAWYSTEKVQDCVHPSLGIWVDHIRCKIILANGYRQGWNHLKVVLETEAGKNKFLRVLEGIYRKAPPESEALVACRQRHFEPGMKAVHDGSTRINIATLIGIDGSKHNTLWLDFITGLVNTKSKYNYQMEIGYRIRYDKSDDLKTVKATSVILKCYKNLKEVYTFLS